MRLLYTLLICVAIAGPLAACENSSELPSREREFKSQYRAPAATPAPSADPAPSPGYYLLGGAALLTGSVVVTLTGRSRKA